MIREFNKNLEALKALIKDDKRTVTKTKFEEVASNRSLIKSLTGESRVMEWGDFKDRFMEKQATLGIEWKAYQGQHGPLALSEVVLPEEMGRELAKRLSQANVEEGDLEEVVAEHLPDLADITDNPDMSAIKKGFGEEIDGRRYTFFRGRGYKFIRALKEYDYKPSKNSRRSRLEAELGEAILDRLRKKFQLTYLEHLQEGRQFDKYQNADFAGFDITDQVTHQDISVYAMELKSSNRIQIVSDAISQAMNYKAFSNYAYIIIPMFDYRSFYDQERLNDFLKQCQDNEIGVISIEMKNDQPKSLDILLDAPRRNLGNTKLLKHLLLQDNREFCPLCNTIIKNSTAGRDGCRWQVPLLLNEDSDSVACMKNLFEDSLSKVGKLATVIRP